MSTHTKSGLRIAAAGAAAAITLAVGAPAFAQDGDAETTPDDTTATPAAEQSPEAPENNAENPEPPVEDEPENAETTPAETEAPAGDLEEEIVEDTAESAEEEVYEFAYLDHILQGADVGSTVSATPQIQVEGNPLDDRVGTLVWFTDAVDFDKWTDQENFYSDEEITADNATVLDEYDNCGKDGIWLACIVTDWTPEDGKTYAPSAGTPINYAIEDEVGEFDMSVYSAFDLTDEAFDFYAEYLGLDFEGGAQFALAEIEGSDIADEEYFAYGEGWIFFEASLGDALPNLPGTDDPKLPTTGASTSIMIGSAAAALLAGAVVFFVMRRRKVAQTWE